MPDQPPTPVDALGRQPMVEHRGPGWLLVVLLFLLALALIGLLAWGISSCGSDDVSKSKSKTKTKAKATPSTRPALAKGSTDDLQAPRLTYVPAADISGSKDLGNQRLGMVVGGDEITTLQFAADRTRYLGKQVRILEEIENKVGDDGFTLGGDTKNLTVPIVGATHAMIVAGSGGGTTKVKPLNRALVTGTVVAFHQAAFAARYSPAWNDPKYTGLEGANAIVASNVDIDPHNDGGPGEQNVNRTP